MNVYGNHGADTITLDGATVSGNIYGGDGDDTFFLTSGSFGGNLLGGDGSDTVTIASSFSFVSIVSNLDGGGDVSSGDGFTDTLNIVASGTLTGENVINWEIINVSSATLVLKGARATTGEDGLFDIGLYLNGGSTLDFDDGFALTGDLWIDSGSNLVAATPGGTGVFSISGDVVNDGLINMSGAAPAVGDVLTIGSTYDVIGGELFLDANLDATELADSLVLNGNLDFGPTEITITDLGGAPSFTGTGILLVDNSGFGAIVDGDFVLDPVAHPGGEIVKGPFSYTLSLESDDILYLQSDVLGQIYGYSILAEVMREEFPILRDRLGDRRYNGFGDGGPRIGNDNAGIWARIDGWHREVKHSGDFTSGEWDQSRGEAEIGLGIPVEVGRGVGVAGLSVHAVRSIADASSGRTPVEVGVDATGFGAGLSFAWFPGGGFYADAQGRLTAWDMDVEFTPRGISEEPDGLSWGASLELGNRIALGANTAVTPRGQVVYTDVNFDSFTDDDGVEVRQDDSASLTIELGVTVEALFPDNGVALFVDASVSHDALSDSSIEAAGFTFESGLEDTWGTLAIGMEADVASGTSAFIQADISSPFGTNFGESFGYSLKAGVRIDF